MAGLGASHWITQLGLSPHPEGGFYRESYRSGTLLTAEQLGWEQGGQRNICTAIYFLIVEGSPSRFHRLRADEVWHHYEGDTVELLLIHGDGRPERLLLGKGADALPQLVVPAGTWFGGRLWQPKDGYALCGCTMAPGFDFEDFELADRDALTREFPVMAEWILQLT